MEETATLLLSVPELLAPLARYAGASGFIRFVTGTSGDSRQQKLSGGRLYTHALAELLPQFHLPRPLNDASLTKVFLC